MHIIRWILDTINFFFGHIRCKTLPKTNLEHAQPPPRLFVELIFFFFFKLLKLIKQFPCQNEEKSEIERGILERKRKK